MRRCVLQVKENKRGRWGKNVDEFGNTPQNKNASGGEDTYGSARNVENMRRREGKDAAAKNKERDPNPTVKKRPQRPRG